MIDAIRVGLVTCAALAAGYAAFGLYSRFEVIALAVSLGAVVWRSR